MNWNKIKHNLVEIHAKHRLVPSDLRTRGMYKRADVFRFSFFPRTISSIVGQFQAGARIYYPSHVPDHDVKSAPHFNCKYELDI